MKNKKAKIIICFSLIFMLSLSFASLFHVKALTASEFLEAKRQEQKNNLEYAMSSAKSDISKINNELEKINDINNELKEFNQLLFIFVIGLSGLLVIAITISIVSLIKTVKLKKQISQLLSGESYCNITMDDLLNGSGEKGNNTYKQSSVFKIIRNIVMPVAAAVSIGLAIYYYFVRSDMVLLLFDEYVDLWLFWAVISAIIFSVEIVLLLLSPIRLLVKKGAHDKNIQKSTFNLTDDALEKNINAVTAEAKEEIEINKKKPRVYYDREETPLSFHKWHIFLRLPLGLVGCLNNIIMVCNSDSIWYASNYYNSDLRESLLSLIIVFSVILIVLIAFAMIGLCKYKAWGWYCNNTLLFTEMVFAVSLFILGGALKNPQLISYGLGEFLVVATINTLIFIYYKKRKQLFFEDTKEENIQ